MGNGKHEPSYWLAENRRVLLNMLFQSTKASIAKELLRNSNKGPPGFFFGGRDQFEEGTFVGMPPKEDGNIMVIGGTGSGKSSGIAIPTVKIWPGSIFAADVKGELSTAYTDFFETSLRQGKMARPYIICDPMDPEGPGYDPFRQLLQDDETHLVSDICDIVRAIHPVLPNDQQPFWAETEQGILAAALLHYFRCGLSFSEAIAAITAQTVSNLCDDLLKKPDVLVKIFLGEVDCTKPELLASIDRGLRNKLMLFAADPYISHLFRGEREGANCFTWDDLRDYNIFLRIPEDRIEQWGAAINLMQTQLIRHLERQPDRYNAAGANNPPTLLLFDEFARLGKLEPITNALATLRSKNVHIALMVQSVAQIDKIYGEKDRRIIFDNCQFQVILRANDPDTQKYISELIGTCIRIRNGASEHFDDDFKTTGYSEQHSEVREYMVHPHTLSALEDVLLLTPYGVYQIDKARPYLDADKPDRESNSQNAAITARSSADFWMSLFTENTKRNTGVVMLSIEKRAENASRHAADNTYKQRVTERKTRKSQEKQDQQRNYIIGELVVKYFPDLVKIEPGRNSDENAARFSLVETFLQVLSSDYDLVQKLKKQAAQVSEPSSDEGPY